MDINDNNNISRFYRPSNITKSRRIQTKNLQEQVNKTAKQKIRPARKSFVRGVTYGTKFTPMEIQTLMTIYRVIINKYGRPMNSFIFRDVMYNLFKISNSKMSDSIFKAWNKGQSNHISEAEWIRGVYIFMRGTFEEKANYAYTVYDCGHRGKGIIAKEKITLMFSGGMVIKSPQDDIEEYSRDLTTFALEHFDQDGDGTISREDFIRAVKKEPLLLEVLGDCLPTQDSIMCMETIIAQKDHLKILAPMGTRATSGGTSSTALSGSSSGCYSTTNSTTAAHIKRLLSKDSSGNQTFAGNLMHKMK